MGDSFLFERGAHEPALALDRAGVTNFRDTKFIAVGRASERRRSAWPALKLTQLIGGTR